MSRPNVRDAIAEDVEWMLSNGGTVPRILASLGRKPESVARALYRAGRSDLAAPFNREADIARRHPCADCDALVAHGSTRCKRCAPIARSAA